MGGGRIVGAMRWVRVGWTDPGQGVLGVKENDKEPAQEPLSMTMGGGGGRRYQSGGSPSVCFRYSPPGASARFRHGGEGGSRWPVGGRVEKPGRWRVSEARSAWAA